MGRVIEVGMGSKRPPLIVQLDDANRRWATCRKVHVCRTCGRRIPVGSKCVLRKWYRGKSPGWIRECAECSNAKLDCRRLHESIDWKSEFPVRDVCTRCDDYPVCGLIPHIRGSEPGDMAWECVGLDGSCEGEDERNA